MVSYSWPKNSTSTLHFDDENRFFLKKLILADGISVAEAALLLSKKQAETANAVLLHCEQNAGAPRDVVGAALALLQRAFSAHSSRLAPLLPPSRKVRSHKSLAKCSSKAMARFTPCRRMLSKLDKSTRLRSRRRSSRLCWASKLKRC